MKYGRLLAAAGALALLAAVYLVGGEPEKMADERLLAFAPRSVRALTLDRPDAPLIAIEKTGDGWRMVRPLQTAADKGEVEGIITAAASAPVEKRIGPVADLAPFGLDRPVTVTILPTDGDPAVIRIGGMNPDQTLRYLAVGDGKEVVAVGRSVGAALFRNLFELRQKRLVSVTVDAVDRVSVEGDAGVVTEVERVGKEWRLIRPYPLPASREQVVATLAVLTNLEASGFYETPEEIATARPSVTRRIRLGFGGKEIALDTGTAPNGAGIVVVDGLVARVAPDLFDALPEGPGDFLDLRLLGGEEEGATRIDYRRDGLTVTLMRDAERWQVTAPVKEEADPNGVEALLHHLAWSEGGALVAGPGFDPKAFGLDTPFAEATVTDRPGRSRTVTVGRRGENYFVTATGWSWVAAMKREEAESLLPTSPPVDRRFFRIDAASVRQATVERLGQRFVVESGEKGFRMTAPKQALLKDEAYHRFIWGLLEMAHGGDYAGKPPAGMALATVEVIGEGGTVNRVAFFRAADGDGYIAVDRPHTRPVRVDARLVTTGLVETLELLMESIDE
ncbi:MAG: DUF4340 domain-containing protein [Nitrospinae bacterium]|nr:DUF4340 domain-containing protein [Nitrospinota bacterium]